MEKQHYIHCRNGLLGLEGTSTTQDLDAIVARIAASRAPRALTIHFHDAWMNKDAALASAAALLPTCGPNPNTTAVFYIWESGALETLRNNLREMAGEPVFQQLLRKVLEYALHYLDPMQGVRSPMGGSTASKVMKLQLDALMAQPTVEGTPFEGFEPSINGEQIRKTAANIDWSEVQARLEIDDELIAALRRLPDRLAESGMQGPQPSNGFVRHANDVLGAKPGTRGFVTISKALLFVKDVLLGVLRRYSQGRDHGLYATCIEEMLRAFKLAGSSANEWVKALQWNRMKQDCIDAFGDDADKHAGTALQSRLASMFAQGQRLDRITLVGHGAGALYACEWLEAAHSGLPASVPIDMVLLAPAVTYERFAATLSYPRQRMRHFRMFALSDALERGSQHWCSDAARGVSDWRRFVYPASLLYLISGVLESRECDGEVTDEPDMPLLGMQRYFSQTSVYRSDDFPAVERVRAWLKQDLTRTVWSFARDAAPGLGTSCTDPRQFDSEPDTLNSLRHLIVSGF